MYDIYTANKENTTSTGNGYRNSYLSTPSVSPSNIILDFDEKNRNRRNSPRSFNYQCFRSTYCKSLFPVIFRRASNAFKIENGEISYPINKAMISGNIFEILKKSEGVKSKLNNTDHLSFQKS